MRGLYLLTCFVFGFQLIGNAQTIATPRDGTNWNDQMDHDFTNKETRTIADQLMQSPNIAHESTSGRVLDLQHSAGVYIALDDFRLIKIGLKGSGISDFNDGYLDFPAKSDYAL